MLNFSKKSISQAVFVIGFERDVSIRTKQFEIEKAMMSLVSGPSVNTNIPDEFEAQMPRVTMNYGDVAIHFSQVTAQMTINVENNNAKSIEVIVESIAKRVNLFQSVVDKVIHNDMQRERGLVLTVNYSVDKDKITDADVSEYIQSHFMKVQPLGIPASAGFNVGYKTDDNFFITLSVGQYKFVRSEVLSASPVQWIDISKLIIIDTGVELKIDINSRPLLDIVNKPKDVTKAILDKSHDFLLKQADGFIGK